jgi:dipeptidyl aminopeptidase/acylaminoacyl peptidase
MIENLKISRFTYTSQGLECEALLFSPEKGGSRFPGVVYLHGHGSDAWKSSLIGYFLANAGFEAFIPSQIGYGLTQGKLDYCGPVTVQAVIDGMDIFLGLNAVDKNLVGIWGVSRGAIVASLIATEIPDKFKAHVFQSGAYEMRKFYESTSVPGIKQAIENELGGITDKKMRERSAIYEIDKVQAPSLILHGRNDDRISVEQAELLKNKLDELKKPNEYHIFELDHYLMKSAAKSHILPFLKKYLKN